MADIPDFLPAPDGVKTAFKLLQSNQAFDRTAEANAQSVVGHMGSIRDLCTTMASGAPWLSTLADQADKMATGTLSDFASHMTDQFDNLPDNLVLATSFIEDNLGFGLTSDLLTAPAAGGAAKAPGVSSSNPCGAMNNFFGSVMGGANGGLGGMLGGLQQALGGLGSMAGGGILGGLISQMGAGGIGAQIQQAMGALGSVGGLASAISTGNFGAIGSALTNIAGVASIPQLGAVGQLLGSVSNLQSIGSALTNAHSIGQALGTIQGAAGSLSNAFSGGASAIATLTAAPHLSYGAAGGLVDGLNSLGGIGQLPQAFSSIAGAGGQLQGLLGQATGAFSQLQGALGGLASGNLSSLMGMIPGGLGGQLMGQLNGMMTGAMGQLQGLMGGLGGLMGGEKGAMAGASQALGNMASAINLPFLFNHACAGAVLGAAGSSALQGAVGPGSNNGNDPVTPDQTTTPDESGSNPPPTGPDSTPPAGSDTTSPDGNFDVSGTVDNSLGSSNTYEIGDTGIVGNTTLGGGGAGDYSSAVGINASIPGTVSSDFSPSGGATDNSGYDGSMSQTQSPTGNFDINGPSPYSLNGDPNYGTIGNFSQVGSNETGAGNSAGAFDIYGYGQGNGSSYGNLDGSTGLTSSGTLAGGADLTSYGTLAGTGGLTPYGSLDGSTGLTNYGSLDGSTGLTPYGALTTTPTPQPSTSASSSFDQTGGVYSGPTTGLSEIGNSGVVVGGGTGVSTAAFDVYGYGQGSGSSYGDLVAPAGANTYGQLGSGPNPGPVPSASADTSFDTSGVNYAGPTAGLRDMGNTSIMTGGGLPDVNSTIAGTVTDPNGAPFTTGTSTTTQTASSDGTTTPPK